MAKASASVHPTFSRTPFACILAAVAILACCAALTWGLTACGSQSENNADAGSGEDIRVALTIVDAVDDDVVFNAAVDGLTSNDTVVDMLKKAGFTEVKTLEQTADDSHAFTLTNDSPYFLGKGWDAKTTDYWVTMFDGSSDNWQNAMAGAKLKNDGHYQYIYTSQDTTTFEYTDAIPDPLEGEPADSSSAQAA